MNASRAYTFSLDFGKNFQFKFFCFCPCVFLITKPENFHMSWFAENLLYLKQYHVYFLELVCIVCSVCIARTHINIKKTKGNYRNSITCLFIKKHSGECKRLDERWGRRICGPPLPFLFDCATWAQIYSNFHFSAKNKFAWLCLLYFSYHVHVILCFLILNSIFWHI